jgi:hypothetical protein
MLKRFAFTFLGFTPNRAVRLFALVVTLGLVLGLGGSSFAADGHRTGVSVMHPFVRRTLMTCFQEKAGRLTDKITPGNCDFEGYKSEHGKELVRIPIEGMRWSEWGRFRARGALGVNVRTERRVRVHVWRRIRCVDGRTFYSRAQVFDLHAENWFTIRLPICGDPLPR